MLTLLTYPAGFGQFSLSPFCVKAAYLLQMSGRAWTRRDLKDPRDMPHQKLPVLNTGRRLIGDSHAIRIWLESQGADFDRDLSDLQKARSRALIHMAEQHMYFHLLMDRWGNNMVWSTIREVYDAIPRILRRPVTNAIRKRLLKGLNTQGIARYHAQERTDRLEADFSALTTLLQQSPFLFGDQPSGADLSLAPMLGAMRSTPASTPLVERLANDTVLTDYLARLDRLVPLP